MPGRQACYVGEGSTNFRITYSIYFPAIGAGLYDDKDPPPQWLLFMPRTFLYSPIFCILLYIDYLLYQILNKTVYSTVESVLLVCLKNTNKTNKLIFKKYYNVTE